MPALTLIRSLVQLDAVYRKVPRLRCQGKCQDYCGAIPMTRVEWQRITSRLGYAPKGDETLTCPMLTDEGRCSVYRERPLICRLWGAVEDLRCPHGCEPEGGFITRDEARALIDRAEVIGR